MLPLLRLHMQTWCFSQFLLCLSQGRSRRDWSASPSHILLLMDRALRDSLVRPSATRMLCGHWAVPRLMFLQWECCFSSPCLARELRWFALRCQSAAFAMYSLLFTLSARLATVFCGVPTIGERLAPRWLRPLALLRILAVLYPKEELNRKTHAMDFVT